MLNSYLLIQVLIQLIQYLFTNFSHCHEKTFSLKNCFKNSYKQFPVFTGPLLYLKRTSLWEKQEDGPFSSALTAK